jgi:chromosome partitioning protein
MSSKDCKMISAQANQANWILVLGGEKGGPGKSTIAQNLSVSIKLAGGDVLLIDADPQATSYEWANVRDRIGQSVSIPHEKAHGDISSTLKDKARRYAVIIVDCGGSDSEALRSAMTVATHLLIPLRPKRRDLATLAKLELLTRLARASNPKLKINTIITQCPSLPSQATRIFDAKDACRSYGIDPLNSITMSRNAYDDAEEDGSSVIESNTDPKAKEEIFAITSELFGDHKWA